VVQAKGKIAILGLVAVFAIGAGGALAKGGGPGGAKGPHLHVDHKAVIAYLKITDEQLHKQLESGKSLAQIAEDAGKTVQGLKDAILAAAKAKLDKEVAKGGKFGATQEAAALTAFQSQLDEIVNKTHKPHAPKAPHPPHPPGPPHLHVGKITLDYLGLTHKQLHEKLEAGKSLAQVAGDQGKTVDGLKKALLDDAKAKLDKDVTKGKLNSTQESAALDALSSQLNDFVNKVHPAKPHAPKPKS
jgi:DNA-binding phage protein